jgi:hypothetical protein
MARLTLTFSTALLALGCAMAEQAEPAQDASAQIKLQTTTLHTSKKTTERAKAAEALGALGASGTTARRDLCQAMMDTAPSVRAAAANALQKIDESTYKLATAIYLNNDLKALTEATNQGAKAEPLTPLILKVGGNALASVQSSAAKIENNHSRPDKVYRECISALAEIAPSDSAANKFVIASLSVQIPVQPGANKTARDEAQSLAAGIRTLAIKCVQKMANVKQAVKPLQYIVNNDISRNRIAAIELLAEIADDDNKAAIRKTMDAHRFDNDATVRQAIDASIKKLEGK